MNRNSLSIAALTMLLPLATQAAVSTIPTTGWNQDIILNGTTALNTSVTATMDNGLGNVENWTWAEAATRPNASNGGTITPMLGLTQTTQTSLTGNGTFEYQNFTGNNAFLLTNAVPTGVLTLTTPASYSTLALYGSAANGGGSATVLLTFSDASVKSYTISGTGITTNWFNTGADRAVIVGARNSNNGPSFSSLYYQTSDQIAINESMLTLSAEDQAKLLTSVTITNTTGTANNRLAVFALSGQAVPESSTSVIVGLVGMLGLVRRRRA